MIPIPLRDDVPAKRTPVITYVLIAANVAVFLYEVSLWQQGEAAIKAFLGQYALVPSDFGGVSELSTWPSDPGRAVPWFTSMFLHAGLLHILFNMWMLWIFGDNVEDRMGPVGYLVFYLGCGVVAAAAHWSFNAHSAVPVVGASGAIAGVMGAYFLLQPKARVFCVFPIIFWPVFFEMPAMIFLLIWFLLQYLSGTMALAETQTGGGVAWWAHIGGFLAGMALMPVFVWLAGRVEKE